MMLWSGCDAVAIAAERADLGRFGNNQGDNHQCEKRLECDPRALRRPFLRRRRNGRIPAATSHLPGPEKNVKTSAFFSVPSLILFRSVTFFYLMMNILSAL